ncbi:hypothetical protein [Candidatus Methylospira mobilis]|uniref:hypothetical protein n=1 Tax=Candidatus Methylospira mobilis TaxID=1808979 RepID=UPI001884FAFB|nr:hypothetical protein [Candidatus Methylospira mobilis]
MAALEDRIRQAEERLEQLKAQKQKLEPRKRKKLRKNGYMAQDFIRGLYCWKPCATLRTSTGACCWISSMAI